jgi:hypothetical protein
MRPLSSVSSSAFPATQVSGKEEVHGLRRLACLEELEEVPDAILITLRRLFRAGEQHRRKTNHESGVEHVSSKTDQRQ